MSERDGVLEQVGSRWRLRFTRYLPHPPAKVWRALTEEHHLVGWFPTTIEGELRAGAPLRFAFRGEDYPAHSGRMIEYDPPHVMEFEWGPPEEGVDEDHEVTRFELRPDGMGAVLTLLTTYDRLGKSARDATGWHACLDALEAVLRGERLEASDRFYDEVVQRYMTKFGPAAATVAPPEPRRSE